MDNIIRIDLDRVKKLGFNLHQYMVLHQIYCILNNFPDPYQDLFKEDYETHYQFLIHKGYIRIKETNKIELREKTIELFGGKVDLFHQWLLVFPIKTPKPNQRYLSPLDPDTVMGKKLRKKWDRLFKNDVALQRKVIKILEAEVTWRLKTMSQEYMNNAETWLNQGNWEKYEYLLEDKEKVTKRDEEDFN